jgi:Holliday junction resolvase RusA-like endonuclease
MRLRLTIPGPPVPKARARVVGVAAQIFAMLCGRCKGLVGKAHGVTPTKTRDYEKHVAMIATAARSHCRDWPADDKAARFGIAIKVYRSRDAGDLGNYEKTIEDALNGVIWPDDRKLHARGEGGVFACEKGRERVEVEVWTLD